MTLKGSAGHCLKIEMMQIRWDGPKWQIRQI